MNTPVGPRRLLVLTAYAALVLVATLVLGLRAAPVSHADSALLDGTRSGAVAE